MQTQRNRETDGKPMYLLCLVVMEWTVVRKEDWTKGCDPMVTNWGKVASPGCSVLCVFLPMSSEIRTFLFPQMSFTCFFRGRSKVPSQVYDVLQGRTVGLGGVRETLLLLLFSQMPRCHIWGTVS